MIVVQAQKQSHLDASQRLLAHHQLLHYLPLTHIQPGICSSTLTGQNHHILGLVMMKLMTKLMTPQLTRQVKLLLATLMLMLGNRALD